jgi:DNA-binding NarL/FixJ family response regulator
MTVPALDTITVFLADDHAVVRQGTHEILKQDTRLHIAGEVGSIDALTACLEKFYAMTASPLPDKAAKSAKTTEGFVSPQVLLLDINLPDGNGLKVLPELKAKFPMLKIILFSAYGDLQYLLQAMNLGADGFLSKLIGEKELCEAIRTVAQGQSKSPILSADLQELLERRQNASQEMRLTAREQEILLHVGQGLTNQEMARQLCLSVKTVDTHLANLMKKVGATNRTQLVAYAYERKLL